MAFANSITVPIIVLFTANLCFTLCIHEYSKWSTKYELANAEAALLKSTLSVTGNDLPPMAKDRTPKKEDFKSGAAEVSAKISTQKISPSLSQGLNLKTNDVNSDALETSTKTSTPKLSPDLTIKSGDPNKGMATYMTCIACHGSEAEGNKMFNSPRLAGQDEWYLKAQLLKYKDGIRGTHPQDIYGMQMAPMAKLLYDEETVLNVLAYIGTLNPEHAIDQGTGNPAHGKDLYEKCSSCHDTRAQGNAKLNAPKLTGQHAWYLERQLSNFKQEIRGTHPLDEEGKQMVPFAQTLNDQQAIKDIVTYIQRLESK